MMTANEFVCARAKGLRIAEPFRSLLDTPPAALAASYAARHPGVDRDETTALLCSEARRFYLAGVDLMTVGDARDSRFVVIEINSAPGFAYCTPGRDAWERAYRRTADLLLERLPRAQWPDVALLTESKIPIETEGFSAVLRDSIGAEVPVLAPADLRAVCRDAAGNRVRLTVRGRPLRGGLRYLHLNPWELLPPNAEGVFVNGTDVDLAGGRDKIAAHHAFTLFNDRYARRGLAIHTPPTRIVERDEPAPRSDRLVVRKVPHGNSGIGVDFVPSSTPAGYRHLEQQLLLPPGHEVDDYPPLRPLVAGGERYVYDLRVVIGGTRRGFVPLMMYARRARRPLRDLRSLDPAVLDDFLKVNIARVARHGSIVLEEERLTLPDAAGAASLGLSRDQLVDAVVQSILATIAVDRAETATHAS